MNEQMRKEQEKEDQGLGKSSKLKPDSLWVSKEALGPQDGCKAS